MPDPREASSATLTDAGDGRSAAADVPSSPDAPAVSPHLSLRRGERIGRYVVLDEIGAGGMGVVLRAFDPELERLVAVKLFRDASRRFDERARAQLLQEGRALAKLQHPNVVAVHDVGAFAGEPFVAMEYVDGESLREWLAPPRSRRAILEVFLAAGRGLAAAHEAGIVHRDFKPSNVIVGRDGRVRVADFGLALDDAAAAGDDARVDATTSRDGSSLAAAGTPPYMAPEQHEGRTVDARADQFAFCAALYEALARARPFQGATPEELAHDKRTGATQLAARARSLPRPIARVLQRGLAADPEARYPTLAQLLDELARARRGRGRLVVGAVALVALGGTAAVLATRDPGGVCGDPRAPLAADWNPQAAQSLERAFAATGVPYAGDSAARVVQRLERYADEWARARGDACAATRIRREQSDALMDRRMSCLGQRRQAMGALIARLTDKPDAGVVRAAASAVAALPAIAPCNDREALLAALPAPPDPATAARVEELRKALAQNAALDGLGAHKEARPRAEALAREAAAVGYAPLHAEALEHLVRVLYGAGAGDERETTARELLRVAAGAHDDRLVAIALRELVVVLGEKQERYAEALAIASVGEAAVERAGGAPALRGGILAARAMVLFRKGQLAEARAQFEEAERLFVETHGELDLMVARTRGNLGVVLKQLGDRDRSVDLLAQSLASKEALLGPRHPDLALTLNNLGNALKKVGRYPEAEAAYERALALYRESLPEHPGANDVLVNLGSLLAERGELARARELLVEALRRDEEHFGPEHPRVSATLTDLADVELQLARFRDAEATSRRALALRERGGLAEHHDTAMPLLNLALAMEGQGRYADAARHFERAVDIAERALERAARGGAADPQGLSRVLTGYGRMRIEQRQLAAAERLIARAVGLWKVARDGAELEEGHAGALEALGDLEVARGRRDAARGHYTRALAAYERIFGKNSADVSFALYGLGVADLRAGRAARALPVLERALGLQRTARVRPDYRAETELALAQALAAGDGDLARAAELAERAIAGFTEVGSPPASKRAAEARRFLEGLGPRH